MLIKINGKIQTVETKLKLTELISAQGLCPEKIIIEHNLHIVPREEWEKTILSENDCLEIVSFVAGG